MALWKLVSVLAAASSALSTPLSTYSNALRQPAHSPLDVAPLHAPTTPGSQAINNSYIVMFKDGIHPTAFAAHMDFLVDAHEMNPLMGEDAGISHVWDSHIQGYAGRFSADVVDLIRHQPEVDYVEVDQVVHTMNLDGKTQNSAPWVGDSLLWSRATPHRSSAGPRSGQPSLKVDPRHIHEVRVRSPWW